MPANKLSLISEYANSYLARCSRRGNPLFVRFNRFWQFDSEAGHYKTFNDDDLAHQILADAYGAFPDDERNYIKAVKELKLRAPRLDYLNTPQFRFWGRVFHEASYCIALKNGIFDARRYLDEKSKFFHRPSPRVFSITPREFCYDADADCPTWMLSLEQWLGLESIELLQEWFGVSCVYEMKYQKFMSFYGPPRSGKSTAQDTLEALVGKRNVSNVGMDRFGGEFGAENMINKLLNISPDIARISGLAEAKLKAMTTGDRMSQDRKYKTTISITPTARLLLVGNDLPLFADRSEALLDRMLIIPFLWSIPEEDRDRDLKFKLQDELPGIFNWAMVGLKRLARRGHFKTTENMKQCLSELKFEINHAQHFIREFVKLAKDGSVYKGELYRSYQIWAKNCGIRENNTLCDAAFGKEVKRAFPSVKDGRDTDGHRPWKYVGISNVFDRQDGTMFVERIP